MFSAPEDAIENFSAYLLVKRPGKLGDIPMWSHRLLNQSMPKEPK